VCGSGSFCDSPAIEEACEKRKNEKEREEREERYRRWEII